MNRLDPKIVEKLNGFLSEEFEIKIQDIHPEGNLKETLNLDSLDYIDLVVLIETNFDIKVSPDDFKNILTFDKLYDFISSRLGLYGVYN